jgi:SAM-dependent methyltransferase
MRKDYELVSPERAQHDECGYLESLWTKQWEAVAQLPAAESVARREEYRLMRPYLGRLPPGSRILDGGCGMGEWTVCLAQQGFDVTGLDISQATIARLKAAYPAHRFLCGDIRRTAFADGTFDAYFSWGTFEHFENGLGECITEAHRILKPQAFLFVSVPFQNWRYILRDARVTPEVEHLEPRSRGGALHHRFYQWRLTKPELQRELALRGFRVLRVHAIGKAQGVHRWLQWDFPVVKEGTKPFAVARRLLSLIMPAGFVSHMILAVAQRGEQEV